ncbi:MAG: response regulator transcription factor, partial [Christensenellales bacterium]
MTKILVAEDDRDLNSFVSVSLSNYGYIVKSCFDGQQALEEWEKNKYDLLLTDIMMPRLDGFSLTQKLRGKGDQTPVIFMSAKDDKPSKMLGYNLGIDDYVTKPFDMDELIMKINAVLRRASIDSKKELTVGNFCMNLDERSATVDGNEISLTVREFDLLFKMLSYPKKTF